jgi:hypothetical protein
MVIEIPAGFEDFFKELGVPVTDEKNFTLLPYPYEIDRIIEISKKTWCYLCSYSQPTKSVKLLTFAG